MPSYRPKKRLGQHFLKSDDIITKIIDLVSLIPDDTVIEIGPGRGRLTIPLAQTGASVIAVEFDRDIIGYLRKLIKKYPKVHLVNRDFLTFEPDEENLTKFKLIGNLPYNITSPVLEWVSAHHDAIQRAVLMMQKEVALRVGAEPGSKSWSPLSIFIQLGFAVELSFDVAPEHFQPPPNVMSTVVVLTPKEPPVIEERELFETVVRTAFRQRRKQLAGNLVPTILPDTETVRKILSQVELSPNIRAEQLSIADFLRLTDTIATFTI